MRSVVGGSRDARRSTNQVREAGIGEEGSGRRGSRSTVSLMGGEWGR